MKKSISILETIIILAFLNIINIVWIRNNLGFVGVSPHPYLIVVLAIAIKYEFCQALTAAIASGFLYSVLLIWVHGVSSIEDYFIWKNFKPMLLFVVIGSVLGHVRTGQNKKLGTIIKDNQDLFRKLKKSEFKTVELKKMNDELSERIVYQENSVSTIYRLSKEINVLKVDKVINAALNFVFEIIGATKCSFHKYEDGLYFLKATVGWEDGDEKRYSAIENNELVRKAAKAKDIRIASNIIENDFEISPEMIEGKIVISAPVLVGKEKKLYGVLNIEKIPFLKYNTDTFHLLTILTDWISHSFYLSSEMQNISQEISKNVDLSFKDGLKEQLQILN